MSSGKGGLVAALDIGSTKICCFIARVGDDGRIKVEGIGHQVSEGMRCGAVVDIEAVESSVRAAADAAERMSGETIRRAFVNVSSGFPNSEAIHVEVKIAGHQVGESDIRHALDEARRKAELLEREVLHTIPVTYAIDGSRGIRDPRGMYGDRLGVDIHVVTAASGPLRNLQLCMERGHLGIAGLCVSPYASGLAALVEDERQMGVTVIDMGGGTTTIAVFMDDALVYTDVVPIGGQHITNDIARGLLTPIVDAERLKTLHGSALRGSSDDREMISVSQMGEFEGDHTQSVPRSMLTGIIQPRVEEIFEAVHERLISSGFDQVAGKRVVLTGGGSQLQGARELATRILDKQVRLGRPLRVDGLAEATVGPAFATCAGLLAYAAQGFVRKGMMTTTTMLAPQESRSTMARVSQWIRENF
ncbi:cell division protein FtsA [Emcibacter sp. SYSU 3D8]|uniref:cell division protein FtsA n=1 Tax=Emcibacter sp. SYSU 3D8 TaxID=3133969 RepID=UPI0031FEE199